MMRRGAGALVAALVVMTPLAHAQETDSKKRAYTLTLMCQVIAADSGTKADQQRTIEATRTMGRAMGYDDKRVSADVFTMIDVVAAKARENPATMEDERAVCRKLGLLS